MTPEKIRKPRAIKAKQQSPVQYSKSSGRCNASPPGPKLQLYPTPTPPTSLSHKYQLYGGSKSDPSGAARFLNNVQDELLGGRSREGSLERVGEEESNGDGDLRDVADKYGKDEKPSREVLFIQKQLYQEDQARRHSVSQSHVYEQEVVVDRWECHSNPCLPYRYGSPCPVPPSRSPSFRRTPGASRPPSSRSNSSGRGSPFMGLYSDGSCSSSSFCMPVRGHSPVMSSTELCAMSPSSDVGSYKDTIQLMVSNLDYNISAREWKKILYTEFQQQVQVSPVFIGSQL